MLLSISGFYHDGDPWPCKWFISQKKTKMGKSNKAIKANIYVSENIVSTQKRHGGAGKFR